jgi:hypothetical protein
MESFEGVWDDLAKTHADALKGHRVEIRVLDEPQSPKTSWKEFETSIRKISAGWRIPGGRFYSAQDFYESNE